MCPVCLYWHRLDDRHLRSRSTVAVTPHLVGWASLCSQGLSPLRTPWQLNLEIPPPCVFWVSTPGIRCLLLCNDLQCFGFKFADVVVPLPNEGCATKNRLLTNWKLRFYTSHQLCWEFFSLSHNYVADPCYVEDCCSPHPFVKTRVNEQGYCQLQ